MIFNGKKYEVISINSEYAVLRDGKQIITVSVADIHESTEKKKKKTKSVAPQVKEEK